MKKVVRDGKVAVLYSRNFGAGWSTWNDEKYKERLLFHPDLVALAEAKKFKTLTNEEEVAKIINGNPEELYLSGGYDLHIAWIPKGTLFYIQEYDGSESVVYGEDFITA